MLSDDYDDDARGVGRLVRRRVAPSAQLRVTDQCAMSCLRLSLGGVLAAKVRDFGSNLLKWAPAQMGTRSQMGTKPATVGHLALGAI